MEKQSTILNFLSTLYSFTFLRKWITKKTSTYVHMWAWALQMYFSHVQHTAFACPSCSLRWARTRFSVLNSFHNGHREFCAGQALPAVVPLLTLLLFLMSFWKYLFQGLLDSEMPPHGFNQVPTTDPLIQLTLISSEVLFVCFVWELEWCEWLTADQRLFCIWTQLFWCACVCVCVCVCVCARVELNMVVGHFWPARQHKG